jgi:O-antigen/teichoic acid export membrane protein
MLVTTPVSAITQLASQVLLPTLASTIRENPQQALRHFTRSKWAFTAVSLCFAWGGMILGPPIVELLGLNKTFVGLGWMVQLLGLRAAFEVYCSPTSTTLLASGASRYSAAANITRLVILVGGLFIALRYWGLREAIIVLVGAPLFAYFTLYPGMQKHMPGALRAEVATLSVFIAGSALATAVAVSIYGLALNS